MSDLIDFNEFYRQMRDAFGLSLADPVPAWLGYVDENGNRKLRVNAESESVGKYYYTGAPGSEQPPGEAYNAGPNPLSQEYLKVSTPIYVAQDRLTGEWYIAGLQPLAGTLYFGDTPRRAPTPVYLWQFTPGLLDETAPPSMECMVYSAPYTLNSTLKNFPTQRTINFTAQVPATPTRAKLARVQLNFDTGALEYAYGAEFNALLTFAQVLEADAGTNTYVPSTNANCFRCGFVKLQYGMTSIRRTVHLFPAQEILQKNDYRDILTADGEVLVADGDVVYG